MSFKYDLMKILLSKSDKPLPNTTVSVWRNGVNHFNEFSKSEGINKISKLYATDHIAFLQRYADWLTEMGYAPSTIHTYLSAACKILDVSMANISKPKRKGSAITRSRDEAANVQGKIEAGKSEFKRLIEFANAVGIRRAEYSHLKGDCLVHDESGHLCVLVKRGKGGKMTKQRILPQDEAVVRNTFTGICKDQYVFCSTELRNHIDLHAIRAQHARDCYAYYNNMSDREKEVLLKELCMRWLTDHPDCNKSSKDFKKWYSQLTIGDGVYKLRGDNYDRAVKAGRPTQYDRVATMAVSMFHLSHFRINVCVNHYFL